MRHFSQVVVSTGIILLAIGVAVSSLSGCEWKKPVRTSFLVVAVDRLGVSRVGCSAEKDDATRSGLAELCDESVRFTHAFTTSTLSAPAMGSILTGQYPYRSGLRHNGAGELGTLSSATRTIAERALELNYRTLFVSGAPPLLRRTGLHQGFEVFDDAIQPGSRRLHRSARQVVEIFTKWFEGQDRDDPFFTVLHLGDMLVPWSPMPDDSGRVRESTVRGQFEEIDESLARLWDYLKKRGRWEHTTIVLVGLQGDTSDVRVGEIPALDLHSDTTHVTLLIKEGARDRRLTDREPPSAPVGSGQPAYNWVPKSWSFDINVSLADLGVTLFDWIDGAESSDLEIDEARSLRSALKGPGETVEEWRKHDRLIVSESAWARWQVDARTPIRVALRKGPHLFINDVEPSIYNTLTDAFEVAPLPRRNSRTIELQREFQDLATQLGFRPFPGVPAAQQLEERWARAFFAQRMGAHSPGNSKTDDQRIDILSKTSVPARLWLELDRWSSGRAGLLPTMCSQLVFSPNYSLDLSSAIEAELARVCPFRGAKEIARWYRSKDDEERARLFEVIFRLDQQRIAAVRVAEASLALGQIWETGLTRKRELEGLEILLAQPEAIRLRQQITRRSRTQPEL